MTTCRRKKVVNTTSLMVLAMTIKRVKRQIQRGRQGQRLKKLLAMTKYTLKLTDTNKKKMYIERLPQTSIFVGI